MDKCEWSLETAVVGAGQHAISLCDCRTVALIAAISSVHMAEDIARLMSAEQIVSIMTSLFGTGPCGCAQRFSSLPKLN